MTRTLDDFDQLTRPYRPELLALSYRMLSSIHDAEDAVQETYLRAWRSYGGFEGRSSLRTWLYRIATTTCLRALENRARRALPTDLGGPGQEPAAALVTRPELPWLDPVPDTMLAGSALETGDPLSVVAHRDSVRLAYIAALQLLPAPACRARAAHRPGLQRRRGRRDARDHPGLDQQPAPARPGTAGPGTARRGPSHRTGLPRQRELLERFVTAMRENDIDGLVATLTDDARYEMPPFPAWFRGAQMIGQMIRIQSPAQHSGDHLLVPTAANRQPAFGLYMPDERGVHRAFNLQVLTVTPAGISHVVAFFDLRLFARFGLPDTAP